MLICHYEKGSKIMTKNIKKNVCPSYKDWNLVSYDDYLDDNGDFAWNTDASTEGH